MVTPSGRDPEADLAEALSPQTVLEDLLLGHLAWPGAWGLRASQLARAAGQRARREEVERALARLAQRGLVTREVDLLDGRVVVVWRYGRSQR